MALILPFLLALAGGAVDLARAYSAWLTVESATRNAAEYVATYSADSTGATTDARRIVCTEAQDLPGFVAGGAPDPVANCVAPTIAASLSTSSTDIGATVKNPIGSAHVTVTLQFHTLVPWPLIPSGGITLSADRTYSIVRGR